MDAPKQSSYIRKIGAGIIRYSKKTWGIIVLYYVVLIFCLSFVDHWHSVKEIFKTASEKFHDEKYITGILIPAKVQKENQSIEFWKGSEVMYIPIENLRNGYIYKTTGLIKINSGYQFQLNMQLEDDRLYVSKAIYDVDRIFVGNIDYEKWEVNKDNISDFSDTDSTLEIVDRYNIVVFGLRFQYPNKVLVRGYSTELNSCGIFDNEAGLDFTGPIPLEKCKDYIIANKSKIKRYNIKRNGNTLLVKGIVGVFLLLAPLTFRFFKKKDTAIE